MKVYVASRFTNKDVVRRVQACFCAHGHEITHDWTSVEGDEKTANVADKARFAVEDLHGVLAADVVVALDHEGVFGTIIEVGAALGASIPVVWVEAEPVRHSVFLYHHLVLQIPALTPISMNELVERTAKHADLHRRAAYAKPNGTRTSNLGAYACDRVHADDYQVACGRTISGQLTARERLSLLGLGVGGEAGEVVEIVKKHLFHDRRGITNDLVEEIGDLLWYASNLAAEVGVDLSTVMRRNVAKLLGRRPEPSPTRPQRAAIAALGVPLSPPLPPVILDALAPKGAQGSR